MCVGFILVGFVLLCVEKEKKGKKQNNRTSLTYPAAHPPSPRPTNFAQPN
jgi:hypothetical protein